MLNQILRKYIWLAFILNRTDTARIFCHLPIPFDSHQMLFHILTDALALDGHQLVALTTLPRKNPMANITEIDIHHTSYTAWEQFFDETTKHRDTFALPDFLEYVSLVSKAKLEQIIPFEHPVLKALVEDENRKFDLMLVDAGVPVGIAPRAKVDTPILLASAMTVTDEDFRLVGAEINPYFYPNFAIPLEWNSSVWQKLTFYYNFLRFKLAAWKQENFLNAFAKQHMGEQALTLKELEKRVGMLFLNVYRFWDRNRPAPIGSVLYMGGFHLKVPNSLPEDLKSYADNSKRGVVLMNMGSKLKSSSLPPRTLRVITEVFSQLPYDFIWKWDADKIPNKPSNIRIVKDLPQNDILHHPKVRAFVSHGGILSLHEAIAAGVPLVGLPVMADQWQNTRQYEELGIGIRLDIDFLSEEALKNAIVAVVEDKKWGKPDLAVEAKQISWTALNSSRYRNNVLRWSRIASDERERTLETATRWVLRLTRHGARHLRSPLVYTTLMDFYMLDVLLVATVCLLVASVTIVCTVKRLIALIKIFI